MYTARKSGPDVYTTLTNAVIAQLEAGVSPWSRPWKTTGKATNTMPLRATGAPYRGGNVLALLIAAMAKGYTSPYWMTYNAASKLGGQVRKGETSTKVIHAGGYSKTETDIHGEETTRSGFTVRTFSVFNADQIDNLPAKYYTKPEPIAPSGTTPSEYAETFFNRVGADIRHGGDRAFYTPHFDYIQLPHAAQFSDTEAYTSTKAHELIHWTAHETRNNRVLGKRFGDNAYAAEELVAELGAVFLTSMLGVSIQPREDHAAYLGHWLKVLRADNRALFTAASHAQKAVDTLQTLAGMSLVATVDEGEDD